MAMQMHDGEVLAGPELVRRLLQEQLPQWAELPLADRPLGGTDNAMYRLGDDLVVRLPRIEWAVASGAKEHTWLPRLEPLLPFAIPVPLALGEPGAGYPWPWAVYGWLAGTDPSLDPQVDRDALLPDLVRFVGALRSVELAGGPECRGGLPLETIADSVRTKIGLLGEQVDRARVLTLWEEALVAPPWLGDPVWVHADLDARNLLVADSRLAGVIDWGTAGVGDPAFDVSAAWKLFSPAARATFGAELGVDDATWERARGWTIAQSVNALAYYTPATNPVLVQEATRWLTAALDDDSGTPRLAARRPAS